MTQFETFSILIAAVVASIGLIQLSIAVASLVANHSRQKKQATIDYMNQIRDRYTKIDYAIIEKFGTAPLSQNAIEEIKSNHSLWSDVIYMLGLLEHLAVGTNTGVFDLKVLNRMSGGYIIRIYKQFSCYIDSKRSKSPKLYIELVQLTQKLIELRR